MTLRGAPAPRSAVSFPNVGARRPAAGRAADDVVDALHVLTSFEMFDALAGKRKTFQDVVPLVQRLCRAAVGARG